MHLGRRHSKKFGNPVINAIRVNNDLYTFKLTLIALNVLNVNPK